MKRLVIIAAAATVLTVSEVPDAVVAAEATDETEAECCWLYCEAYRDLCEYLFDEDRDHCDAFYEGCIDGCRYPNGPTS